MLIVNSKNESLDYVLNAGKTVNEADNSWGEVFESIICEAWNNKGKVPGDSRYAAELKSHKLSPETVYKNIYTSLKSKMKSAGSLRKLPNSEAEVTQEWIELGRYKEFDATPNNTPKTDIISDNGKFRISVKESTGARLMSGAMSETMATLLAAATDKDREKLLNLLDSLIGLKTRARINGTTKSVLNRLKGKDSSDDPDEAAIIRINAIKTEIDNMLKSISSEMRNAILIEAASGAVKFGKDSPACANYILTWDPKTGDCELTDVKEFIKSHGDKYKIKTAYKSSSVKMKDPATGKEVKTGQYDSWMVMSIT